MRIRLGVAAVVVFVTQLGPTPAARADETPGAIEPLEAPRDADRPQEATGRRWYGGSVLLANAAGLGLTGGCLAWDESLACVAPFLAAGSAVHVAHGNYGRAALSLAAHIALPSLGAILGNDATRSCDSSTSHLDGGTITTSTCGGSMTGVTTGAWIGIVAAAVLDAALAYDDAPAHRRETAVRRPPPVLPAVAVGKNDATFGLQGRF
jgi:hypothetical protein